MTTLQLNEAIAQELSTISNNEGLLKKALKAIRKVVSERDDEASMSEALSSPQMLKILRDGRAEIASGNIKPIELDDLWK